MFSSLIKKIAKNSKSSSEMLIAWQLLLESSVTISKWTEISKTNVKAELKIVDHGLI